MAGYQSAMYHPDEWHRLNNEAITILKKIGTEIPDDFHSTGVPQVFLGDLLQSGKRDHEFDFSPFKGRLVLDKNSGFNSATISPFPHGPVRLTLVRWGAEPDQCGYIEVHSGLNGTAIVSYRRVYIGHNVLFGPDVVIMDCDGHPADRTLKDHVSNCKIAPVTIEDDAWLGLGCVIMKGVTVGHHATVAAYSLVTKDVPPHCVVAGNPARLIKDYRPEIEARQKEDAGS